MNVIETTGRVVTEPVRVGQSDDDGYEFELDADGRQWLRLTVRVPAWMANRCHGRLTVGAHVVVIAGVGNDDWLVLGGEGPVSWRVQANRVVFLDAAEAGVVTMPHVEPPLP